MDLQEITIRVDPIAAAVYQSASEQDRLKLDALLSLRLSGVATGGRAMKDIIRDASSEATANGLTPDILREILDGK